MLYLIIPLYMYYDDVCVHPLCGERAKKKDKSQKAKKPKSQRISKVSAKGKCSRSVGITRSAFEAMALENSKGDFSFFFFPCSS